MDSVTQPRRSIDPRLRVVYLAAVAVGVFFLKRPWQSELLVAVQALLWLAVGLGPRRLLRQVIKLWGFALFISVSFALTSEDPETDRWVAVQLLGWQLPLKLNATGAVLGALMVLRVLAVVLASQVARAGDSRAIAAGLDKLAVPKIIAVSIDAVLALLGGDERHGLGSGGGRGRGSGGGGGGGGGRGQRAGGAGEAEVPQGFWAGVKRLARGDVGPIVERIERQIQRAEQHAIEQGVGERGRVFIHDVGVIAGISLTMLGIKALKILPSIPFAPGHKLVLLTPLYIVAAVLSRSRFGATLTGLTMGTVAFLMGDGRYGIFEILKHVTPGLICDALVPLLLRGGRRPGPVVWSLVGGIIGAGRFATIFGVTLTVQAPAVAYAMLIPGLTVHTTFGVLSGYVSYHLVNAILKLRRMEPERASGPALEMHPGRRS
jgi:hypothetical protein